MNWLMKLLGMPVSEVVAEVEEADPVFPRITPEMARSVLANTGYRLRRGTYLDPEERVCCAAGLISIADHGVEEAVRIYDGGVDHHSLPSRWPLDYAIGLEAGFEGWRQPPDMSNLYDKGYADGVALKVAEVK